MARAAAIAASGLLIGPAWLACVAWVLEELAAALELEAVELELSTLAEEELESSPLADELEALEELAFLLELFLVALCLVTFVVLVELEEAPLLDELPHAAKDKEASTATETINAFFMLKPPIYIHAHPLGQD